MKVFHLKFNKEADGDWYIDFPNYPFAHHNLLMVAGSDLLCEYVAKKEGHPEYALVDVTTGSNKIDGKEPDIVMTRFKKDYGAYYHVVDAKGEVPVVNKNRKDLTIPNVWICPVTLLVLYCYPKQINIYLKKQ